MILDNPSYFGKFSLVIFVILMILVNGRIVVALVILGVLVNLVNFASLLDLAILMSLVNLETHCTTALHSRAGGGTCVACVNWMKLSLKDPLKKACYGPLGGVSGRSYLALAFTKGWRSLRTWRTTLRGGRRREE